jgi:hypothetical protein
MSKQRYEVLVVEKNYVSYYIEAENEGDARYKFLVSESPDEEFEHDEHTGAIEVTDEELTGNITEGPP